MQVFLLFVLLFNNISALEQDPLLQWALGRESRQSHDILAFWQQWNLVAVNTYVGPTATPTWFGPGHRCSQIDYIAVPAHCLPHVVDCKVWLHCTAYTSFPKTTTL